MTYRKRGIYRTTEGVEYDTSTFSYEERRLYGWMQGEATAANTWIEFQQRTEHGILEASKKAVGDKWQEHPLSEIQLDLMARVGVRLGELRESKEDLH